MAGPTGGAGGVRTTTWTEPALSSNVADPLRHVLPGVVFPDDDDEAAREWLTAVHYVARRHGGRVLGVMCPPRVDRNFYDVCVHLPAAEPVTLLLNTAARLVAAVEGDRPFAPNAQYTDVPSLEAFETLGLQVASPADMAAPWTEHGLQRLTQSEAEQVGYHRPARVGDVLFNWFD